MVDPKPTTTDIGSDVTLTCVWVGNPPLTLTWTKKDSNMVRCLLPVLSAGVGWGGKDSGSGGRAGLGQGEGNSAFRVEARVLLGSWDLGEEEASA